MGEHRDMERNGQIMMTYRCSASCKHCLVMGSPRQSKARVSVEDAVEYGRDFRSLGRRVIIAGGEALLFPDHVMAIARALKEEGIPVAFVESNGSWCVSDRIVTERLTGLRESGVEGMYFSIDAFHQEFVPAERICRGTRVAEEIFGTENVYAPRKSVEDVKALQGVARDSARLRDYVRGSGVRHIGRAAQELAPFAESLPTDELLKLDCRDDLDVDRLKEIQVDPFGFVRPDWCPGVNLGNTRSRRVAEVARTEHVRVTPLLRDLAEGGPAALLPLTRSRGFTPGPVYASKCHLCFSIRRHLVRGMPDEFGPTHVYETTA